MNFPNPFLARALDTRDVERCLAVIHALPLINVARAREQLSALLQAMRRQPPAAAGYLKVLEAMRQPLAFIQRELGSHYAGKPLPPSDGEQAAFKSVVGLSQQATEAYVQVARLGGQPTPDLALICQRCLQYAGQAIVEHFRARRALPPGLWSEFNGYYQTAEEWGLAEVPVPEPIGSADEPAERMTTCAATYVSVLLFDLLDPYRCQARELLWILSWLRGLALQTSLAPVEPGAERPTAYGVDLRQDRGLRPLAMLEAQASRRQLDTSRLDIHVQQSLERLKRRVAPSEMGFGECPASTANRLLRRIRRHLDATPRQFVRACAGGCLRMCSGFHAVHAAVKGADSGKASGSGQLSQNDIDRLSTFREQTETIEPLQLSHAERTSERWDICDQSLNGFHLLRKPGGNRVGPSELLAIKAPGAEFFRLAKMVWVKLEADGRVRAGVRLIPSRPRAVLIRLAERDGLPAAKYVHAFLLPAVPALGQKASLVLPLGWFHPERIIEIKAEETFKVRLTRRLERGADFEQAVYAESCP